MWGLADYRPLAERLDPAAAELVAAAGPLTGRRVLDVAAGTGNVAARALAAGATVTAVDLAPRMVELGQQRTGDAVRWLVGDVEELPLPDGSADVALSAFGMIFAPHHERAVAELHRVLASGGTVALTAWEAGGYMARMTALMQEFLPPAPGDWPAPVDWGRAELAAERLAGQFADIRVERRSLPWHFDSPAAMTAFSAAHSPAHVAVHAAAGERSAEMAAAVERLAAPDGGPVRVEAEYLLVRARAR